MTRRVFEKLGTKKVCVDFLAPPICARETGTLWQIGALKAERSPPALFWKGLETQIQWTEFCGHLDFATKLTWKGGSRDGEEWRRKGVNAGVLRILFVEELSGSSRLRKNAMNKLDLSSTKKEVQRAPQPPQMCIPYHE